MSNSSTESTRSARIEEMIDAARDFYRFGWLGGSSGNMSFRFDDDTVVITSTGGHKGALDPGDFVDVDLQGDPKTDGADPSVDTDIHLAIYEYVEDAGAVVHVHHLQAALCSDRDQKRGSTHFHELRMLHALGVEGDEPTCEIPVLDNPAEVDELATLVEDALRDADSPPIACLNVHNHGLYVWGRTIDEARRHVEACAYLFEYSWQCPMHPKKSESISGFQT